MAGQDPVTLGVTTADVSADSDPVREALYAAAVEAGCGESCRLIAGFVVEDVGFAVWHGTPLIKAELHLGMAVGGLASAMIPVDDPRVIAWIKQLHELEVPFDA